MPGHQHTAMSPAPVRGAYTNPPVRYAPGWPGTPPRWTSSAKSSVGTALRATSRVWFTLSPGILNEIYYPRVDRACMRDLGLIVTDGHVFFSEEKRHAQHQVAYLADGASGGVLPGVQRSRYPAGPLGDGPWVLSFHARGRDCRSVSRC